MFALFAFTHYFKVRQILSSKIFCKLTNHLTKPLQDSSPMRGKYEIKYIVPALKVRWIFTELARGQFSLVFVITPKC